MTVTINGTTGVAGVDGTAATPAIQGNDTNTGIFFPAADTIAFAEGGAEVARFDSSGNLGIGTSSPTTKLNVFGLSPSIYLQQDGGAAGNTQLRLNAAGGSNTGSVRLLDKYIWASTSNGSQLNIGNDLTTAQMVVDSSGNLLVGVTSGSGRIRMKQSADAHTGTFVIENFGNTNTWSFLIGSDNNLYFGYNGTSRGQFNNSSGAYTALSDQRLKKNIASVSYGLDSVMGLNPVEYNMVDESDESQKHLGFIAQEASQVLPSTVSEFPDGTLGMDRTEIIPVLVKAIQEQQAIITDLKSRIEALEQA
jgi:hypothetical protein